MRFASWVFGGFIVAGLGLVVIPTDSAAQGGMIGRAKRRAEEAAKRKTDAKVDRIVDDAINSVSCTVGDSDCLAQAKTDGKEVTLIDESGVPLPKEKQRGESTRTPPRAVGAGAWANYDFLPGEKPLRIEDMTADVVGDFPRGLEASSGNAEIVEWEGRRWLRINGNGRTRFLVPAGGPLPQRFTLEFEFLSQTSNECWIYFNGKQEGAYLRYSTRHDGGLVRADGRELGTRSSTAQEGTPFTARLMVDGSYVKAYADERRVVNAPKVEFTRGESLMFYCDGTEEQPVYITNVRLAAGGRKLYDALAASGRVATQGIYFDTGLDAVKPESTPTIKEIATMLTEHPELNLLIEGHTDNVGAAATNLALSQKRAAAVKSVLVTQYGVAETRLTTQGFGAGKPTVPNTTAEGRQQNRRVELVKK